MHFENVSLTLRQSGFLATTICFGLAVCLIGALRVVLARENARRDQLQKVGSVNARSDVLELTDRTDKENLDFRYVL